MIPRYLKIAVGVLFAGVLLMGAYLWHMRGKAAQTETRTADKRPVAPPVAGPTEQVILYVADDDPGILRTESARIPLPGGRQQLAEELLRAVVSI